MFQSLHRVLGEFIPESLALARDAQFEFANKAFNSPDFHLDLLLSSVGMFETYDMPMSDVFSSASIRAHDDGNMVWSHLPYLFSTVLWTMLTENEAEYHKSIDGILNNGHLLPAAYHALSLHALSSNGQQKDEIASSQFDFVHISATMLLKLKNNTLTREATMFDSLPKQINSVFFIVALFIWETDIKQTLKMEKSFPDPIVTIVLGDLYKSSGKLLKENNNRYSKELETADEEFGIA